MNTEKLKQLKELLDMGAISQEEFEQQKTTLIHAEKPKKNIGLLSAIIVIVVICILIILGGNTEEVKKPSVMQKTKVEAQVPECFAQACPVEVSSTMYDNIIGVPEIKCTFKNNTDKEIAAIKLYFSPKDVYGEEVNTILTTKELYTDNSIAAGSSSSRCWQLLDSNIKAGEIYVYSVYFSDGTEWGDKESAVSDIKKYAYKISAKY